MVHNQHEFELTFGELGTLFFRKKRCPVCGTKLQKETVYEEIMTDSFGLEHYRKAQPAKKGTILYCCPECGKKYTLEELGKHE